MQRVGCKLVTGGTVHSFLDLEKVCGSGERGKGCGCQFLTSAEVTSCSFCLVWCGVFVCFCVRPLRINPLPPFISTSHCFISHLFCTCFVSFFLLFHLERETHSKKRKEKASVSCNIQHLLFPLCLSFIASRWKLILNADGTQNSQNYDISSEFDVCMGLVLVIELNWWGQILVWCT